ADYPQHLSRRWLAYDQFAARYHGAADDRRPRRNRNLGGYAPAQRQHERQQLYWYRHVQPVWQRYDVAIESTVPQLLALPLSFSEEERPCNSPVTATPTPRPRPTRWQRPAPPSHLTPPPTPIG